LSQEALESGKAIGRVIVYTYPVLAKFPQLELSMTAINRLLNQMKLSSDPVRPFLDSSVSKSKRLYNGSQDRV